LAGGLRALVPAGETVQVCDPERSVPPDAQILVTLLDDAVAIRRILVPSIEWVHVLGAGVDGFPFDALGERRLTCSRGAAAPAIAEWVLAVMLAFEKSLPESWVARPPEYWNRASLGTLSDRTVGLVGFGAIASEVARLALAFGAKIFAIRRSSARPSIGGVELAFDLRDLIKRADHLVVAAPATGETRHLIDAGALAVAKPGLHLVNIARGSLVDQEALRGALDDGRVARASLDTVDPEPLPEGHWLYAHPKVRLSPHISWSAPGTMLKTIDLFVENLRRFRAGELLGGVVDPVAQY
jgi:phosphoglycerate dehydrogenase-like enzyme